MYRRFRCRFLAAAVGVLALALCSPAQAAKVEIQHGGSVVSRNNPVVLVHGLNPIGGWGWSCDFLWGPMRSALESWGWASQNIDAVSYYSHDRECDHTIDSHGSHNKHFGNNVAGTPGFNHSSSPPNSHIADTPIEHLGYHLAWYIYDRYSRWNKTVDLVGHSMGGLMIRYMLTMYQRHDKDFPPKLMIGDVATMETPHAGAAISSLCAWSTQCQEIRAGSVFLNGLDGNPQATGGTEWTVIGSYADGLVSEDSAVAMDAPYRLKYQWPGYGHLSALRDSSAILDASADYSVDGAPWIQLVTAPHYSREVDLALAMSGR